MKISPIAAQLFYKPWEDNEATIKEIKKVASMTHKATISLAGTFAHIRAIGYCLGTEPEAFDANRFCKAVCEGSDFGNFLGDLRRSEQNLTKRLKQIQKIHDPVRAFHYGTSKVYDCLPFSYTFFIRKPTSIESLYDVVSAGGDNDTNGAIVGSLLGALNGDEIFPIELVENLDGLGEIEEVSKAFCEQYGGAT
jgi:ADP-ribosylglycohydrolase